MYRLLNVCNTTTHPKIDTKVAIAAVLEIAHRRDLCPDILLAVRRLIIHLIICRKGRATPAQPLRFRLAGRTSNDQTTVEVSIERRTITAQKRNTSIQRSGIVNGRRAPYGRTRKIPIEKHHWSSWIFFGSSVV